jgi:hypothetical protein
MRWRPNPMPVEVTGDARKPTGSGLRVCVFLRAWGREAHSNGVCATTPEPSRSRPEPRKDEVTRDGR